MKKKKVYSSRLLGVIHQTAEGLYKAGGMSAKTMREFDETCLTEIPPLKPKDIRALRKREEVSQAVFARHLNVTTNLISQWERGEKHPRGPSLKLLALVEKGGIDAIA